MNLSILELDVLKISGKWREWKSGRKKMTIWAGQGTEISPTTYSCTAKVTIKQADDVLY